MQWGWSRVEFAGALLPTYKGGVEKKEKNTTTRARRGFKKKLEQASKQAVVAPYYSDSDGETNSVLYTPQSISGAAMRGTRKS